MIISDTSGNLRNVKAAKTELYKQIGREETQRGREGRLHFDL